MLGQGNEPAATDRRPELGRGGAAVSGHRSAVRGQRSVVSGQRSVEDGRLVDRAGVSGGQVVLRSI